ncbi:MAG: primosomal protein N' [Calditrichaeota bacterium]|nr:primosomal protein N' [Calditrichota bacterium]
MAKDKKNITSLFANVVFPIPVDHAFSYEVPEDFRDIIRVGSRVLAPFGRRKLTGFVVELTSEIEFTEVKPIADVLDDTPIFSQEMLQLARWIAGYYLSSWGEVLEATLPKGINLESKRIVRLVGEWQVEQLKSLPDVSDNQRKILQALFNNGALSFQQLRRKIGSQNLSYNLTQLQKKGYISVQEIVSRAKTRERTMNFIQLAPDWLTSHNLDDEITGFMLKHSRQAEILKILRDFPEGLFQVDLLKQAQISLSGLKSLLRKGIITVSQREVFRDYYQHVQPETPESITLNKDQRRALDEIESHIQKGTFQTFLLFGVTGSGKTQVYMEAIAKVLSLGKTAIVLVPEISLTPQTVKRFKDFFGNDVAVLHSRMSSGERYDSWRRIQRGDFHIVIGPRSAVFAPLKNIGLIVVDEEQEATYKQYDMAPRYHARDVAIVRAKMNNALVILGSATPSVESFFNAEHKKYALLSLPGRVEDIPMPEVEIVDMSKEHQKRKHGEPTVFSSRLLEKIAEKLTLREQVILLQNRRGFSTYIVCQDCGYIEKCIHCDITLTYHREGNKLMCHYCNYQKAAPEVCPNCGGVNIRYSGVGTQRVEDELNYFFPKARIVRMDMDTTGKKGAHDQILRDFSRGLYDILLGTQMVAKGLDFPRVTLVGVISADTTLLIPDYRASERTFQLLTQVAGRAGRKDKQGEVIIQTYAPKNHSILFAQKHDYLRFYVSEINQRKELLYPPFGKLIEVEFRGPDEKAVSGYASRFVSLLNVRSDFYQVLGPSPAPLAKIQGNYRYHIILKNDRKRDATGKKLREEVKAAFSSFKKRYRPKDVKITIDVDPIDLW